MLELPPTGTLQVQVVDAQGREIACDPSVTIQFVPERSSEVRSRLALLWGCETFVVPRVQTTDEMVAQVDKALLELGRGQPGDHVVIVAGTPPGTAGSTNTLRVHRLGGE